MGCLNIIIAEAALETIPREIIYHPAVMKNAKRRGKKPEELILDISYHYAAMKKLKERWKRGRPDIIHVALLHILGSPANKKGLVRTFIHTIKDYIIFIHPETRLPKNYLRFIGLMEQLFKEKRVPPKSKKPLLKMKKGSLTNLLLKIKPSKVILLTQRGNLIHPERLGEKLVEEAETAIIIGGFPHGKFTKKTLGVADEIYSIYPEVLEVWEVISIILHNFENAAGIFEY